MMEPLAYFNQYKSKNTLYAYRSALKTFFETTYDECPSLDVCAERYFTENRNYEEDVSNYLISMKKLVLKTVRLRFSITRTFLVMNDIELASRNKWCCIR